MAAATRSRSIARRAPASRTVIVREGAKRAGAVVRAGASRAAQAARDEKHTITALIAAGVTGYMRRENMLDNLPAEQVTSAVGPEGLLALVAFGGAKFMKSKTLEHVATGLGCVAINRLAAGDAGTGTGT